MEKLIVEYYFWAWMVLEPRHLGKLLIKAVLLTVLILAPLFALNGQLAERGIHSQPPTLQIDPGTNRERP